MICMLSDSVKRKVLTNFSLLSNWHFSPEIWDYSSLKKSKYDLTPSEELGKYRKKNCDES